jgi:hypothetical protein
MDINYIQGRINRIHERYDGDNDCSPDYPTVNWTDEQLAECIEGLLDAINDLNEKVSRLESFQRRK